MKKLAFFLSALFVSAMAMAADAKVTTTFTSKDWKVGTGEIPWTATGAAATALESSGSARGVQITLANIKTSGLTLTNDSIKNLGLGIKKVEVVYSSNCEGTSDGTISVAVGTVDFGSAFTIQKENNATISFANTTAVKGDIVITFTSSASKKSVYVKSITVTYEKNQSSDPTISANDIDFGAYVIGLSESKTLTVEGENLTEAISYDWMTGGIFGATGTLTEEGGDLTIAVLATTDLDAKDTLILTSGEVTTKVAVVANVFLTDGYGTKENPFTTADVIKLNNEFKGKYWVEGNILGAVISISSTPVIVDTVKTNIAIGDDEESFVPVALPSGSIRDTLNIVDNPELIGKNVKVYGDLQLYFTIAGVKNTSDYVIPTTPAALDETKAAATEDKKVMRDGQLIIIRDGVEYNAQGARR